MHRCVIYARISVVTEESVSVARQIESCQQYAASRGWTVVATFTDGMSATDHRPEDRPGWGALLASGERFNAVVIWKIDRLARKVLDFLHADAALQARGAGLVAVADPVDMTTPSGRAFSTMLSVFGEMEAAAISARVRAARSHLVRAGRVVGGAVPYGWHSIPNPDGPGLVLARDPDRIGYVRGMVERAQRGESVYAVRSWLDEVAAPLPTSRARAWSYSTVERLLRNPVLAGMTAFNPGNASRTRGAELLRGPDGLPIVDESVAILPVAAWRALVQALDERGSAQARPRATRSATSSLLSGLVWCGEHDEPVRMHRGTFQGRHGYSCPTCHQTITSFEGHVVERFLYLHTGLTRFTRGEIQVPLDVRPEIDHRLAELGAQLAAADDEDEVAQLVEAMSALRALRREARPQVVDEPDWFALAQDWDEDWAEASTTRERRAILDDALARITVTRGRVGRGLDPSRLSFDWRTPPDRLGRGPRVRPDDETLAEWGAWEPWNE